MKPERVLPAPVRAACAFRSCGAARLDVGAALAAMAAIEERDALIAGKPAPTVWVNACWAGHAS